MSNYVTKSKEQQALDLESLSLYKRISRDDYFEYLQLITKLEGIDTYEAVNKADRELSTVRALKLEKHPLDGEFDLDRFQRTHEYLFQDIYYFAGQLRDLPMEIDSVTRFASPKFLEMRLPEFFRQLKADNYLRGLPKSKFIGKLANYLTDINILHPFREGNGRTKRQFFGELSATAGWKLDWNAVSKDEWKMADECAFDSSRDKCRDTSYLRILLDKAIQPIGVQKIVPVQTEGKNAPVQEAKSAMILE